MDVPRARRRARGEPVARWRSERAYQDIPPAIVRLIHHRDQGRCQTPGCRSASGLEIHHIVHQAHGGTHDPENLTLRCGACHGAHHRGDLTISGIAPNHLVTRRRHDPTAALTDPTAAPASVPVPAPKPEASSTAANQNTNTPAHVGAGLPVSSPAAPASTYAVANPDVTRAARASAHVGATRFDVAVRRSQARDVLIALGWKSGVARGAVDEAWTHVGQDAPIEELIREALRRCPRPRS